MKIEKSQVTKYEVRIGREWASIVIDDHGFGKGGRIFISSGWGDWTNYWCCPGDRSFISFLADLDIGYFAGKVKMDRWFDDTGTIKALKDELDELHEWDRISEEDYDDAKMELEIFGHTSVDELYVSIRDSIILSEHFMYDCPIVYDIDPSFSNFWDRIWEPFIKQLNDGQSNSLENE
jgi:hypothetical protein